MNNDIHTYFESIDLGDTVGNGTAECTYRIKRYKGLVGLKNVNAFEVHAKIRVTIPGLGCTLSNSADNDSSHYNNYPAALVCSVVPNPRSGSGSHTITPLSMFPKTVNAAVELTKNSSSDEGNNTSREYSSGSSTSDTNTFGASANLGFFGDAPTGGVGADFQHSHTMEHSMSSVLGRSSSIGYSQGEAASASVKEWSSFGSVDANGTYSWCWGQTYPWDVLKYNNVNGQNNVDAPSFVQARLYDPDDNFLYPPSDLALYGLDFTMTGSWLVTLEDTTETLPNISFDHVFQLTKASQSVTGSDNNRSLTLSLNSFDQVSSTIPSSGSIKLDEYGLSLLEETGTAQLGFDQNSKIVEHSEKGVAYINYGNTVLVYAPDGKKKGAHGISIRSSDAGNNGRANIDIYYKTLDEHSDIKLAFRHVGSKATIKIAGLYEGGVSTVDYDQPGNDVQVITIRNLDITSPNYYNDTNPGLNKITMEITFSDLDQPSDYTLYAMELSLV